MLGGLDMYFTDELIIHRRVNDLTIPT